MHATIDDMHVGDEQLEKRTVAEVVRALRSLRGEHGVLTVQKFSRQPVLVQLLGDGDLLDGFIALKREIGRLQRGNKFEAAVAYSIGADHESALDRLQAAADALSNGEPKDQRTARHWSDRGLESVARELIAFATIRGNLGRDLIGVALHDGDTGIITMRIVQVASTSLRSRAPMVTVVHVPDSNRQTIKEIDLSNIAPESSDTDGELSTTAHSINIALPDHDAEDNRLLSISVMARGSPAPTYFLDSSGLRSFASTFAVHRSLIEVCLRLHPTST